MPVAISGARIQGVEDFKEKLARMQKDLRATVLTDSAKRGAEIIKAEVVRRAPVSQGRRSDASLQYGHLRDNIQIRMSKPKPEIAQAIVSTGDAFWGLFSEYGTENEPARPWIRPAFDSTHERAGLEVIVNVTDYLETHDG